MLTRKQHELLLFIHRHLGDQGVSPSFDEMKDALGLKSKSGIHRLITALVERGFIHRLPHRARAVEVLRLPEDLAPAAVPAGDATAGATAGAPGSAPGFAPRVIQGDFSGALVGARAAAASDALQLPLYGRIAAGTPIEALRDYDNFVDVPVSMLGSGEHYALEVDGDSMIEAGIYEGDTIIIERTDTVENGAIVVALIDNEEATLKRVRRKGGAIALEPANPSYETRIFPPERVKIQGRLVGLLRSY
ncbi:MAG: transcriptional repressor LexA [Proteobacteria bacterium]|nr:transcriptional repressor LexA [Pseudomonadota bacterium]